MKYLVLAAMLATAMAGVIHKAAPAAAADQIKCLPRVDDFDFHIQIGAGEDAYVWWCDMPDGLVEYWVTGEAVVSDAQEASTMLARYKEPLTGGDGYANPPSEMAHALIQQFQPRCYVDTVGATTQVLSRTPQFTIAGPVGLGSMRIQKNQWVSCGWRLPAETQRYCLAVGTRDLKGRMIGTVPVVGEAPMDGWVPCRMERSPDEGWTA